MVTTIQLTQKVKSDLDRLKEHKESYEEVIVRLVKLEELERRKKVELLIEGYKEMAKESMEITKEFEKIEEDFDWEWK